MLVIGNQEYQYHGFDVEIDPDTGEYSYIFHLDESKPVVSDADEADSRVGRSLDYKGVPYYLAQMNEFVRTFSSAFNAVHKTGENLNGEKGMDFFNGTHPTTGENYTFVDIMNEEEDIYGFSSADQTYYKLNAGNFTVTKVISEDEDLFAAAESIKQGVEENKILAQLLALKQTAADNGVELEANQALTRGAAAEVLDQVSQLALDAPGMAVFRMQK